MSRFFIYISIGLSFFACSRNTVYIKGRISGFEGNLVLLAEIPDKKGTQFLDKATVRNDGSFVLKTSSLSLPAPCRIMSSAGDSLAFIVDNPRTTWIEGKFDPDVEVEIFGSALYTEYMKYKKILYEYYDGSIRLLQDSLDFLKNKSSKTEDEYALMEAYEIRIRNRRRLRTQYIKKTIVRNSASSLVLFLLKYEIEGDLKSRREIFGNLRILNKESNIYLLLKEELEGG